MASVALEQAQGLAQLGHTVRVVATTAPGVQEPLGNPGLQIDHFKGGTRAILRLAPLSIKVLQIVNDFRPAFIWCPTYRGFGIPAILGSIAFGIPYGIYLHGTEINTEVATSLRRVIMNTILRRAALICTNSRNTALLAARHFPTIAQKLTPITPGVSVQKFNSQATPNHVSAIRDSWQTRFKAVSNDMHSEPLYFISLCRMSRNKGIDLVLQAFSSLLKRTDLLMRYIIVGHGPDLEYFKSLVLDYKLTDNVIFVGSIDYEKTGAVLKAADIYIQPSQPGNRFLESFGISFLEAQAAGLPCIGSDWGGVPEAVIDGKTAILAPVGDVAAIASAMEALANSVSLRKKMGAEGQTWAEANSWEAHTTNLNTLITGIVARS